MEFRSVYRTKFGRAIIMTDIKILILSYKNVGYKTACCDWILYASSESS
jgi:hypothetical protein